MNAEIKSLIRGLVVEVFARRGDGMCAELADRVLGHLERGEVVTVEELAEAMTEVQESLDARGLGVRTPRLLFLPLDTPSA